MTDKNILIISPEPWGINFVSKHHYALELSNRNIVFFLNPPSKLNQIKQINSRLFVIDYSVLIRGINHFTGIIRDYLNGILLNKIKTIGNISKFDIIWSFDPYRFQNMKIFQSSLSIYHPVDIHHTKLEKEVVKTSDIILGSSELILDKLGRKKNCFKISHGIAKYFINEDLPSYSKKESIKIGYIGNLHYRYLDTETLTTIINQNPNIEFHFIGSYSYGNLSHKLIQNDFIYFLKSKNNVKLYGALPSVELPNYINKFDAFLLCYKGDTYKAELSNPHKILEYLSTGKVVISHYIDEYRNKLNLIEMVEKNTEIPQIFKKVINNLEHYNRPSLQKARKDFASKSTYQKKIKEIELIIKSI